MTNLNGNPSPNYREVETRDSEIRRLQAMIGTNETVQQRSYNQDIHQETDKELESNKLEIRRLRSIIENLTKGGRQSEDPNINFYENRRSNLGSLPAKFGTNQLNRRTMNYSIGNRQLIPTVSNTIV